MAQRIDRFKKAFIHAQLRRRHRRAKLPHRVQDSFIGRHFLNRCPKISKPFLCAAYAALLLGEDLSRLNLESIRARRISREERENAAKLPAQRTVARKSPVRARRRAVRDGRVLSA